MNNNVVDRFYLKTFSIAYELPFFDIEDQESFVELARQLADIRKKLIDTLDNGIEYFKFGYSNENPDQVEVKVIEENNYLFLFYLIARIDSNLLNGDELKETWYEITSNIEDCMSNFFESKNLMFRIIKES